MVTLNPVKLILNRLNVEEGNLGEGCVWFIPKGWIPVDGYCLKSLQLSICSLVDPQFGWVKLVQDEDLVQCLTS